MLILGIDTSCDDTSVSIVRDGRVILSNCIASQILEHQQYGGVVPEIASRRHCENILPTYEKAFEKANVTLDAIDAIAVTAYPGLIGALLVGVSFAKGLSLASGIPFVPVHHLAGHIAACYLSNATLEPPFLCLIASGGHTHLVEVRDYTQYHVVGRTRDDAAGECLDKCARAMGYPYPGGIAIDKLATTGDATRYPLPTPRVNGSPYDFSFSGLKTAVVNLIHNANQRGETLKMADLASSLQGKIVDILCEHTLMVAQELGYQRVAIAGGVAANSGLRETMAQRCAKAGIEFVMPSRNLCGDNGAMIAAAGYYHYREGERGDMGCNAMATKELGS